ncbi:MAG: hypothetical protein ABSD47_01245 [Candidatus Methylomirabilota bacterium]
MTKAERERAIAEALEWMTEEDGKFPGWMIDPMLERVLLDSTLIMYPQIRLIPVLANFRMHWYPRGATKPHIWRRRWQNWVKGGAEWDPLISGESREPRGNRRPATGDRDFVRPPSPVPRPSSHPVAVGEVVQAELAKMKRLVGS